MNQPEREWESRFEETLKNRMRSNNDALLRNEILWIMDFIRTEFATREVEVREEERKKTLEVMKMHWNMYGGSSLLSLIQVFEEARTITNET